MHCEFAGSYSAQDSPAKGYCGGSRGNTSWCVCCRHYVVTRLIYTQGRIPGFTEHIFPDASRPYLANTRLFLFLFPVGLEIDAGVIGRNASLSASVALAGMVLPFGISSGLAVAVYTAFIDQSVKFTHFTLFTHVAYSITAFPALCRILTELKLLDTAVGIVVLSAGVGNGIGAQLLLPLLFTITNHLLQSVGRC
jgi:Kef-type K+ transport system membrane component KefB